MSSEETSEPQPHDSPVSKGLPTTSKESLNIVFTGHVDSGKSTILGHILLLLGEVEERTLRRYERECKAQGKPSFHFAWVLDQSEEERRRGITISTGQHAFDTPSKRVSALDAPGHIEFVTAMISGASQADVALLVVSAIEGELQSGLGHGTKEHLYVLRILGVTKLLIVINKMDAVEFSEERFNEVVTHLKPVLKQTRFGEGDILGVCPVSGLTGANLVTNDQTMMPWYQGPPLVQLVDSVSPSKRLSQYPLRFVVNDVSGRTLYGKIETGMVKEGDVLHFVPSGTKIAVKALGKLGTKEAMVSAGDSVEVTARADFVGVTPGNVGCPPQQLCPIVSEFEATVQTFSSLKNAILPGSQFVLSIQAMSVSATVKNLVQVRQKSGNWSPLGGFVKCVPKDSLSIICFAVDYPIAAELGDNVRSLGRFVLRQGGDTVGGGILSKIVPQTT